MADRWLPSWVVDIEEKVREVNPSVEPNVPPSMKTSIYRVPADMKDLNKKVYKPQIVSFGPYHHGDPNLLQMEEHKQRALLHFLKRANKPFRDFVDGMEEIVQQLQESYQNLGDEWSDKDRFLQLMIVDGCFMLEVIRVANTGGGSEYSFKDPIFSTHGLLSTVPYIRRDMLMMENQLPLLVLQKLVAIEAANSENDDHINMMVLEFLVPSASSTPGVGLGLHPLDLFRRSLLLGQQRRSARLRRLRAEPVWSKIIWSALELYEAGIRFKKSNSYRLQSITFERGLLQGVLSLPVIVVDDNTEDIFHNLVAFERLHMGAGQEVTSYICFMSILLKSAKDVSLLVSKGIVLNLMGSDDDVVKLLNGLSKNLFFDPDSYIASIYGEVAFYTSNRCRTNWNQWMANLTNTYFKSPWTAISLVAAIFLLLLTVTQTVYTVYPYYHPPQHSHSAPSPRHTPSPPL